MTKSNEASADFQKHAGLGILGVLDHNKQVVPVRGHHDLMLLKEQGYNHYRFYPQEREIFCVVNCKHIKQVG